MHTREYQLHATYAVAGGRPVLWALGTLAHCEARADRARKLGLPATVRRVGNIRVIDRGPPERADDPGEPRAA
jgi:hypothetical protein